MRQPIRRLDALTGLRFLAAAAVIADHISRWGGYSVRAARFGLPAWFGGDMPLGQSGVGFFFVLSGFILAVVYPRLGSAGEVGRFLLARFARLWPAHLAGIAFSMVVAGAVLWPVPGPFNRWGVLLAHLTLTQSWFPTHAFSSAYNGPSWSVSTEFAFYLLFVPLVHNWARTWWWKLPLTFAAPAAVAAGVEVFDWPARVPLDRPSYEHFLYYDPLARLWQFALGMATALAWQRFGRHWRVGPALGTGLEFLAIGGVVAANYYANRVGYYASGPGCGQFYALGRALHYLLYNCSLFAAPAFALLVFVMANEWGLASRPLASRPLVFLGEISYGVYILHWPLLVYFCKHQGALAVFPGWAVGVGFVAALLTAAHLMYVFLERPARRYLTGLWPPGGFAGRGALLRALVTARPTWLAAEATLLLAGLAAVATYFPEASFRTVTPAQAEELVRAAPPGTRGVRFGGRYLLRGATWRPAEGGRQLRLVWESLEAQPPRFHVWVQFSDPSRSDAVLHGVDGAPDLGRDPVPPGRVWDQRLFLPDEFLADSSEVSVSVLNRDENGTLPMAGGTPDRHGSLLLWRAGRD